MVIFITSVRRDRLGSSQTRELVQFKLPFSVLKLATAAAGAIKIQCAIWSRFWCLGGSRGLTKWVRLPHLQIGLRKQNTSVKICSPFSCRYLEEYQNFFAGCDFVFGTRMSHFGSNCLASSASYGGEFEVAWPLRLCNRAIAKTETEKQL